MVKAADNFLLSVCLHELYASMWHASDHIDSSIFVSMAAHQQSRTNIYTTSVAPHSDYANKEINNVSALHNLIRAPFEHMIRAKTRAELWNASTRELTRNTRRLWRHRSSIFDGNIKIKRLSKWFVLWTILKCSFIGKNTYIIRAETNKKKTPSFLLFLTTWLCTENISYIKLKIVLFAFKSCTIITLIRSVVLPYCGKLVNSDQ